MEPDPRGSYKQGQGVWNRLEEHWRDIKALQQRSACQVFIFRQTTRITKGESTLLRGQVGGKESRPEAVTGHGVIQYRVGGWTEGD